MQTRRFFIVLLLFIAIMISVSPAWSSGDAQSAENSFRLNKEYWKGFLSDTKEVVSAPARWEKSDWLRFSVIAGVTAGLYAADQEIQDHVQENRDSTSDDLSKIFKKFGEGGYTLPPLAALYAYGHYYENEKARKTALLSVESFVITGIFTQIGKFSLHRHRPSTGDSHDSWDGPGVTGDNLSFPSGHSSSAFSIATVLASEYKDHVWVPPLSYGIATLTALSRVNDNAHWASDVFAGSALGYFTAKAVVGLHNDDKESRLSIDPVTNGEYTAVMVSWRY
ncbi:MAG: phosphatase PAP2 family protein [Nitrospirota bacterium]|nr:phosphatase PAP2 family protein [Nitrospirota bacterium]